ncbi:MAG: DUF99 family protein [Halobacteriales archaeon]
MKPGVRAVGIAESYAGDRRRGDSSTIAGAVVRADRVVDGLAFTSCTVGGTDATGAIRTLLSRLDREDVRYVLVAGIAPAWYNVLDLRAIAEAVDRPVLSVSFEASEGLEPALKREFSDDELSERLDTYRRQPARERLTVNGETVFVRRVGLDDGAPEVVRAFTPEGGRPEPLRIARTAARAADQFRADS